MLNQRSAQGYPWILFSTQCLPTKQSRLIVLFFSKRVPAGMPSWTLHFALAKALGTSHPPARAGTHSPLLARKERWRKELLSQEADTAEDINQWATKQRKKPIETRTEYEQVLKWKGERIKRMWHTYRAESSICEVDTKAMLISEDDGIKDEPPLLSCKDKSSERPKLSDTLQERSKTKNYFLFFVLLFTYFF